MVKYPILLLPQGGSVIVMKERAAAPSCIDNTWRQSIINDQPQLQSLSKIQFKHMFESISVGGLVALGHDLNQMTGLDLQWRQPYRGQTDPQLRRMKKWLIHSSEDIQLWNQRTNKLDLLPYNTLHWYISAQLLQN